MSNPLLRIMTTFLAAAALAAAASVTAEAQTVAYDIDMAEEICAARALDPLEGVWIYPDDNVTVMILRSDDSAPGAFREYDITVVASTDCLLSPGERIGSLSAGADPKQYRLTLYTGRGAEGLTGPRECLATLDKGNDALFVKGRKLKWRLNPFTLLPRFWRIARVSVDNPLDKMQPGMLRIFPSYDGNGSSRREPRYL